MLNHLYITSYLDIAERAFGSVLIIKNLELYLVATGLVILESENLNKLFPNFMVKLGTLLVHDRRAFVLITAVVILPSMLLIDLSILFSVSAAGVMILCSIFSVGAFGSVGFHWRETTLLNVSGLSTAVSLYIVCFGVQPVIHAIYTAIRNKNLFSQVCEYNFLFYINLWRITQVTKFLVLFRSRCSVLCSQPSHAC